MFVPPTRYFRFAARKTLTLVHNAMVREKIMVWRRGIVLAQIGRCYARGVGVPLVIWDEMYFNARHRRGIFARKKVCTSRGTFCLSVAARRPFARLT
jgi:hypothetical protein